MITLGTGFGSVLFVDGHRIHMEIAHHPFRKGRTYEDELGHAALLKKGKKRWNKRVREAIEDLQETFGYDRLYIGGGNARFIRFKLPDNVQIVSNLEGLLAESRYGASARLQPRSEAIDSSVAQNFPIRRVAPCDG